MFQERQETVRADPAGQVRKVLDLQTNLYSDFACATPVITAPRSLPTPMSGLRRGHHLISPAAEPRERSSEHSPACFLSPRQRRTTAPAHPSECLKEPGKQAPSLRARMGSKEGYVNGRLSGGLDVDLDVSKGELASWRADVSRNSRPSSGPSSRAWPSTWPCSSC